MTITIEVDDIRELEELKAWLATKSLRIKLAPEAGKEEFFTFLNRFKIQLPVDYKFNRDEANGR